MSRGTEGLSDVAGGPSTKGPAGQEKQLSDTPAFGVFLTSSGSIKSFKLGSNLTTLFSGLALGCRVDGMQAGLGGRSLRGHALSGGCT